MTPSTSSLSRTLLAAGTLTLAAWSPAAHAKAVLLGHRLIAHTSVSELVSIKEDAIDGTLFDQSAQSLGLGGQGQISSATAAQAILFDAHHGASGQGSASMALGAGDLGVATSTLAATFDLTQVSAFTVHALLEASGTAHAFGQVQLSKAGPDDTERFVFDLNLGTPALDLSGVLDPGHYLLQVGSGIDSLFGPGTSGSSRFQFNFRLDAVEGGNSVPEPSSIALVLGAALVGRTVRRRSAH
ncbi:MAG: PEP-CTERM sorting domain-containing protein [Pelomonas sp.]|nr:PEP-CTERM sorting domain-containing protein [Roseateles sp.]